MKSLHSRSFLLAVTFALACGQSAVPREGDGLDVSGYPEQVRADYALFANRCSKCHSIQRPLALASREASDEYWERYVERMRRQPGSGISRDDGLIVRRFLHFYSNAELSHRKQTEDAGVDGGSQ